MSLTGLPPELQTLILLFIPFTSHFAVSKVSPLWSSIVSSHALQKARYGPKFTTLGLPNLHRLLNFNGDFKFTIKGDKVISHKFRNVIETQRKELGEKIITETREEWMDITNHPFLKEPIFSPFITYLSAEESDKQPYGNLEDMVLDNFFIEVIPTHSADYSSFQSMSPFHWSVENDAFQVRVRDNATIEDLIHFLVRVLKVNEGGDGGYEVILTHLWDAWWKKWVGF
ncbi:hypothetical protein TWF173_011306 [Orbilia oligospora]|nr:hypothetical protein TWF173_011306 [Orbilia oligospora]